MPSRSRIPARAAVLSVVVTLGAVAAWGQGAPPLNPLKERIRAGHVVLGAIAVTPSVPVAQVLARAGLDWLFIDLEHGPIDLPTAQAMVAATQGTSTVPLVRVAKIDPVLAKPALDIGAFGIVFPMARTAEDARLALASVRYPPEGVRGVGPSLAAARWGMSIPDYLRQANEHMLTVLLIEQREAVDNIDAILAVPGIDVAFIAPFDLSASLGHPGQLDHPEVQAAIARVEAAVTGSGVALGGIGLNVERTNALIRKGYRVIVLASDVGLLQGAVGEMLKGIRR
jgi:4-hydroxy-2-oxoheptanedioate aldolase